MTTEESRQKFKKVTHKQYVYAKSDSVKYKIDSSDQYSDDEFVPEAARESAPAPKRGRGRPPKYPKAAKIPVPAILEPQYRGNLRSHSKALEIETQQK